MILDDILEETKKTVSYARYRVSLAELKKLADAAPMPLDLAAHLRRGPGIGCIAEIKRRSPSKGWIRRDADAVAIARSYQMAGAAALSVLTDGPFFGGCLDDLRAVRAAVQIPLLRKDFIIDPYQVVEARAAGADAVLLIVAALRDEDLAHLLDEVHAWGMQALVETHDAHEADRALAVGAKIVGVNHRDLRTFQMNMDLAVQLRPRIGRDRLAVAESGISTPDDVARMQAAGMDGILVGESLMRAPDPGEALGALLAAT
jgi:indole-3-glycerol phosphate synthase